MAENTPVKLTHPDAEGSITVRPDMVDTYRDAGWQTVEDKKAQPST